MTFIYETFLTNCPRVRRYLIMAALAATGPGCANVHSYTDPDGPRFDGGYVASLPVSKGEIRAVTYNVEFAANVDDAARELADLEQLAGADIIFLQEMDEHGVDRMARLLECNYLYYPAIRHTMNDKNFGNAVLSRWPLENPEKVILPHADIKRSQKRIAVGATVVIDTLKVRAYSVHTENLWLEPQKRIEQSDSLGERIAEQYSHLIVGGDFNTVTKPTLEATEEVFWQHGLERVSREAGSTVKFGPLSVTSDHVFAKGFETVDAGVAISAEASDHVPVWVVLKPLTHGAAARR